MSSSKTYDFVVFFNSSVILLQIHSDFENQKSLAFFMECLVKKDLERDLETND